MPTFFIWLDTFKPFNQRFDLVTLLMQRPLNSPLVPQNHAIADPGFVQFLDIRTPPMICA